MVFLDADVRGLMQKFMEDQSRDKHSDEGVRRAMWGASLGDEGVHCKTQNPFVPSNKFYIKQVNGA